MRLRRTRRVERQQIKWFAYASVAAAGGGLLRSVVPVALEVAWLRWAGFVPMVVGVSSIPIYMGIAIMRYRLYEIDLIINRTLVYGSLSLILAALYLGGIVISQRVFGSLTGQDSTLAVVASALLIAALFHPLRRRIQSLVHRRFYRRRNDARKTLEAYSATLREETDLRELNDELVKVVRDTMPPANVSDAASKKDAPSD
jgi:hypothetical protein